MNPFAYFRVIVQSQYSFFDATDVDIQLRLSKIAVKLNRQLSALHLSINDIRLFFKLFLFILLSIDASQLHFPKKRKRSSSLINTPKLQLFTGIYLKFYHSLPNKLINFKLHLFCQANHNILTKSIDPHKGTIIQRRRLQINNHQFPLLRYIFRDVGSWSHC